MLGRTNWEISITKTKKDERWVIYKDAVEATKITSEWYLWIHHTTNTIPRE